MNMLMLDTLQTRDAILALQDAMLASENACTDMEEYVTKYFAPGIYVREMRIPKDTLIVGKIHRESEVCMLTKGIMLLKNEHSTESVIVEAPYTFIAEPGKKVGLALEASIFINVHPNPTNTTDIDELEKQIVIEDYAALEESL